MLSYSNHKKGYKYTNKYIEIKSRVVTIKASGGEMENGGFFENRNNKSTNRQMKASTEKEKQGNR